MALAAEKSTLTKAERIVRDPGQFKYSPDIANTLIVNGL